MTDSQNADIECSECNRKIIYLKDASLEGKFGEPVKFSRIHPDHIVLINIKAGQVSQEVFLFKNSVNKQFTTRINSMISGLKMNHWKNIVIVSTNDLHRTTLLDQMAQTIEDKNRDINISKHGNIMKFVDDRINYTFFNTFDINEEVIGDPDISYIDFLKDEDVIPIIHLRNLSVLLTESQMTIIYIRTIKQQKMVLTWLDEDLRLDPLYYEGIKDDDNFAILINKPSPNL